MTSVRLTCNGFVHELASPLLWEEVLAVVGRAFFPDSTPTGPALPPPEPARRRW